VVVSLAVLGFLCWIVWAGAHGAWTAKDASARVLGYGLAALFAIPLLMLLRTLPRLLRPRYVVLDAVGLSILHGREQVVVPWQDVAGIGLGYENAPAEKQKVPTSIDGLKELVKDYLADRTKEALQISGKRRVTLEIFPARPDVLDGYPKLTPYWEVQPPPFAGLPAQRWSFPLPPVVSIAQAIDRGGRMFRPDRWLGWYARPWSGPTG
jgi:hypothetical protein